MATPREKLADALQALHNLQSQGRSIIRTNDLTRLARERLVAAGYLEAVINGWYIPTRPDAPPGETTAWYASYWDFIKAYLTERFGTEWSLSPEQSLALHAGQWRVPAQLLVRAPAGRGRATDLLHGTSIYELGLPGAQGADVEILDDMRVYTPGAALIAAGPAVYANQPTEMRTVLASRKDFGDVLSRLLAGGHSVIAGRLAGACRNIGRVQEADEILQTMRSVGYDVRESDPFPDHLTGYTYKRDPSPYAQRIRLMWQEMKAHIVGRFPEPAAGPTDVDTYLQQVEEIFVTDAYHSLSIEGYRVDAALIERVRQGTWNPQDNAADRQQKDAMAARGYFDAFQSVKDSVRQVLTGGNPGKIAEADHRSWYRQLFSPSVTAGLVPAASLAGYRNAPVYIRGSMHVPLNPDALRDAMPVFFELLEAEEDAAVRIVLGHFVFVYIHPYLDGNGRMARFLMNVMFAAGGYPWTVIPVQKRKAYMGALEAASAQGQISPFADFLAGLIGQEAPKPE